MSRHFAPPFLFCMVCLLTCRPAAAVTIAWSPVGSPGNAADPADGDNLTAGIQNLGAVPYSYNIATYDVTASQYVEFLNVKDPTGANPLHLYRASMSEPTYGGVNYSFGNPDGSKYSVISSRGDHPINFTTWYDAIRFANWMNNGQGSGDTETGAYTLGTLGPNAVPVSPPLTHNPGSQIWLPTEDEWYKAAYYNPATGSYYQYPTSSDTTPTESVPTATPNSANYGLTVANLTDVGAYSGTTSPFGAFDMGGDVFQWDEAVVGSSDRLARGGAFFYGANWMLPEERTFHDLPTLESFTVGFRLASVPEPSTAVLAIIACGVLCWWRKRQAAHH